jgi:hypothetical protein
MERAWGHPRVGCQVEIVGEVLPFNPVVLSDKEPVRIGIDTAGIDTPDSTPLESTPPDSTPATASPAAKSTAG